VKVLQDSNHRRWHVSLVQLGLHLRLDSTQFFLIVLHTLLKTHLVVRDLPQPLTGCIDASLQLTDGLQVNQTAQIHWHDHPGLTSTLRKLFMLHKNKKSKYFIPSFFIHFIQQLDGTDRVQLPQKLWQTATTMGVCGYWNSRCHSVDRPITFLRQPRPAKL